MDQEPLNEIESRLKAMRPTEPGVELHRRIARSMRAESDATHTPLPPQRLMVTALAVAAMIVLAGLAIVIYSSPSKPGVEQPIAGGDDPPDQQLIETNTRASIVPTLYALQTSWRESPDTFDTVLDRALMPTQPVQNRSHASVFIAADARRLLTTQASDTTELLP